MKRSFVGLLAIATVLMAALASRRDERESDMNRRAIERRAIEVVNWAIPVVNFDMLYQAARAAHAKPNEVVYWSRTADGKNQMLTPNPDVIYLMPFLDTRGVGPVVLEIPASDDGSINGTIMDAWQAALEDVGPAGADKGKGAKYLVLPPNYRGVIPRDYIALRSDTYQNYAVLRATLNNGSAEDRARAIAYGKRIQIYPLVQASDPSRTRFVDAADVVFDATIPYDVHFFRSLDRMVQAEPWLTRDKVMIDMLKTVGIEKGKFFNPDLPKQELLRAAAGEAKAWLDARYEAGFKPFYEGKHWIVPTTNDFVKTQGSFWEASNTYALDSRGVAYSHASTSSKRPGTAQYSLLAISDADGNDLDGDDNYRLHIPANVPVRQYWSATVYDRATHALIRDANVASRSSNRSGLQKNADGSVDIYFGPRAPSGKTRNWIPTNKGGEFEVLFRFYGAEKALYNKTWKLPDIEETN